MRPRGAESTRRFAIQRFHQAFATAADERGTIMLESGGSRGPDGAHLIAVLNRREEVRTRIDGTGG